MSPARWEKRTGDDLGRLQELEEEVDQLVLEVKELRRRIRELQARARAVGRIPS